MKRGYEERLRDKHAEKMRQASERAKAEKTRKSAQQKPRVVERTEPDKP